MRITFCIVCTACITSLTRRIATAAIVGIVGLLALAGTSSTVLAAAPDYLNPYATDVGRAIADDPAALPRQPLDINGGESPACRDMRIQLERARNAPPPQRPDPYPEGPRRDGLPNLSRHGLATPPPVYGPLQQLENRYRRECLK